MKIFLLLIYIFIVSTQDNISIDPIDSIKIRESEKTTERAELSQPIEVFIIK